MSAVGIKAYEAPKGVATILTFQVEARPPNSSWINVPTYAVDVAEVDTTCNTFEKHTISIASIDTDGPVELRVRYAPGKVNKAAVRPVSLGIETEIEGDFVKFSLPQSVDVMLEINDDKWQALHVLINEHDPSEPTGDADGIWYFGPGLNNGVAYSKVVDGTLSVPSNTIVHLAGGAFLTAKLHFCNVSNSGVRGHGFIYNGPNGGAILIERSNNIVVQGVTSLGATGFSLTTGNAKNVHIDRYRSFSSCGNGDGVDLFCSQDVLVENCFLRNSDDTIAIYGHRWDYHGDTCNITIQNCTLLADIAHPVHIGTHGNPAKPETLKNISIRDLDILDHHENQLWYQGCISLNAGDENLIEEVLVENIRVERISKGQLVNIRVMKNAMWTTAPGRGVRNVTFRNIELDLERSKIVNPSQIMGFDATRKVENINFENLKIGGVFVHDRIQKPRWYMVSDFVPIFANEHTSGINFTLTKDISQ